MTALRIPLTERMRLNLIATREEAGLSPEGLASKAWPDVDARKVGGQRIRAVESGRLKLSSPFADDIADALELDVSFYGQPVKSKK